MPLLMCPNCQSNMQTLNRSNVEFDMCPSCRGVWLDRGELEKLMESASAHESTQGAPQDYKHRGKRNRSMDIFDIFG